MFNSILDNKIISKGYNFSMKPMIYFHHTNFLIVYHLFEDESVFMESSTKLERFNTPPICL